MKNEKLINHSFLASMYRDNYFPDFLVKKIEEILLSLCEEIESKHPNSKKEILRLTHAATCKINDLEKEFIDNGSELETMAREAMAEEFELIVQSYGFSQLDIEDVIAPREW